MTSWRTLWLLLLSGCGAAAPAAPQTARAGWAMANDVLSQRMQALELMLHQQGLTLGRVHDRVFLAEGDATTVPIVVPANRCWSIVVAAAHTVRDLDSAAYAPSGELIAEDVQPDAHPTLQFCAGNEEREVYLHLAAYDGAGPFYYAAFESGSADDFDKVREVVGGRPGVELPGDAPWEFDANQLRRTALQRGFAVQGAERELQFGQDQSLEIPIPLVAGRCVTLAFFGEPGLEAELRLIAGGEEPVARDGISERSALQYCARETTSARLVATGRGAGDAVLLAFDGSATEVGGDGGLWLGERLAAAHPVPSCRDCVELTREEASVQPGQAGELAVDVPPGQCVRWQARARNGVRRVDLELDDRLAQGRETSLHRCRPGSARLRWSVVGGGELELAAKLVPAVSNLSPNIQARLLDHGWNGHDPVTRLRESTVVRACETWISDQPLLVDQIPRGQRFELCEGRVVPQAGSAYVVRIPHNPP